MKIKNKKEKSRIDFFYSKPKIYDSIAKNMKETLKTQNYKKKVERENDLEEPPIFTTTKKIKQ